MAMASTLCCELYHITADFSLTFISTAIVFPIVFSIGGAYKRRETALDEYGAMKANARSLYFMTKHWVKDSPPEYREKMREKLRQMFNALEYLFSNRLDDLPKNELVVYKSFEDLSLLIYEFRAVGLNSSEASRAIQFLTRIINAFERVKHIFQYRTPRTLRAYSDIFIWTLPVLYGPYFAHLTKEYSPQVEYFIPILFSVVLVCLDNIQAHLENPFDRVGEDDVNINGEKFISTLENL